MPRRYSIGWWMLKIIHDSGRKGIQKKFIMDLIFSSFKGRNYDPTNDRGWYCSYFYKGPNFFCGDKYQYGLIPKFCEKVPGTNRWRFKRGMKFE